MQRKTNRAVAACAVMVMVTGGVPRATAGAADVISQWNIVTLEAGRAESAPLQTRALAMVHAAMFDAANAVDRRFDAYLVDRRAPPGLAADAAAASAAHAVLVALYPDGQAVLGAALTASLARIAAGNGRDASVAFGRRIGQEVVARRQHDGARAVSGYQPGSASGDWRPTPPAHLAALAPHWGAVQPFLIPETAGFVPPAPPAITSARYARDFSEVKLLGAKGSARTLARSDRGGGVLDGIFPAHLEQRRPPGHRPAPGAVRRRAGARLRPAERGTRRRP
jgi:hypothetical protein